MNRGQCFVDAIRGTAEQTDLLAGDHGKGAVAKTVEIARRCVVSAKTLILFSEDLDNATANRIVETYLAPRVIDSVWSRRMEIELRDSGKIREKCGIEACGSGQLRR
jgi:hypothetical protein